MLFNFKCKKVLFKDFFPLLLLCMFEEQMELKHVIIQARLRAARVRYRVLTGWTSHRAFDIQLPVTEDSDCSLKLDLVYFLDNSLWPKEIRSPSARQNFSLYFVSEMGKDKHCQTFVKRVSGQRGGTVEICSLGWDWRVKGLESKSSVSSGRNDLSSILESCPYGMSHPLQW